MQTTLRHVRAFDGVRGIAIVMVLLYHGGHGAVLGGWQGVTVFFVLSGFLITSLLVAESSRTGDVDVRHFYLRRAARLAPALLVVLAVETVWTLSDGLPGRWEQAWSGLAASLTSTANLVTVLGGPARLGDSFGWAWSLSIEEQFYLLWVPFLILSLRRGWPLRVPAMVAAGACLASAVLRARVAGPDGSDFLHAHYSTDTRLDALLAGCLLALLVHRARVPSWTGWLGLPALAALAWVAYSGSETYRSSYVLQVPLVVGGTAALLAAVLAAPHGLAARLLSLRVLVRIGELSYGLYLWNVFARDFIASTIGEDPWHLPAVALVIWLAATAAIAEVSLRRLELPIRRWAAQRRPASSHPASGPARQLGLALEIPSP